MKKNKGFTLIELMIVVAIIAIIAAIAIPNLLRSRVQSNESATIGNLKAVVGAQTSFSSANNTYAATFGELTTATPPFLDGAWDVAKAGYTFTLAAPAVGEITSNFDCNADPVTEGTSGNRHFFVDASGIIRAAAAAADANSDPIGEVAAP